MKLEILAFFVAAFAAFGTIWQAWVSNDTEHRQLRAYIGAHQGGVMGLEDDGPIGVGFNFVNHGLTPAQNFNLIGIVELLPYPLSDGYKFKAPPPRAKQNGIIFPNETDPVTGALHPMTGWMWQDGTISRKDKAALLTPKPGHTLYAHGEATYDDVFGQGRKTEFCVYLNPDSIIRDNAGQPVRDKEGHLQYQWAPVIGCNKIK